MAATQSAPALPLAQFVPHDDILSNSIVTTSQLQQDVLPISSTNSGADPLKDIWKLPPSNWVHLCHPRAEEVANEVDGYFLQNWNFPNAKAERVFLNAGFSRVTCLYFPLAKDDRIHFACRLLTVLFLIDGGF